MQLLINNISGIFTFRGEGIIIKKIQIMNR